MVPGPGVQGGAWGNFLRGGLTWAVLGPPGRETAGGQPGFAEGSQQEEGKDAIEMKPGDVVNIPAGVKHWHGAAPDSWFSHLAVEVPGVEGSNEWLEPVGDDAYCKLTLN